MKGTYSQAIPMNARITVNYKTSEVLFDYPFKSNFWERYLRVLNTNYQIWFNSLIFHLVFLLWLLFYYSRGLLEFKSFIYQGYFTLFALFLFIGVPALLSIVLYYNKRYMTKWFPVVSFSVQKWKGYYYKKIEAIKEKEFVLPLFRNIVLKYNAEGDFADKLEVIEIKEHEFEYIRKSKRRRQDDLWKATFKFNDIPKDGFLEIWFC